MTNLIGRSRGQVIVIVALVITIVIGMAGLAIDGGRGYWERRQAQNAADHAALAAADADCDGADPEDAGEAAAAANGFTDAHPHSVVISDQGAGRWEAVVGSTIETTFATVIGFETVTSVGRAVAHCRNTSGEGFALFAGGTNCQNEGGQIEFSGSTNEINGAIHSNGDIKVGGSNNDYNGATTSALGVSTSGSGNDYDPAHVTTSVMDWPVVFNLEDYRQLAIADPNDDLFYRTETITWDYIESHGDGLYYSTQKIDISGSGPETVNVTLVSEKEIIISGSKLTLNPYMHNLLAFSAIDIQPLKDRCSKEGVKMSGSENAWKGFIYAPMSEIVMDGSSNSTLVGSLISWAIKVSGSTLNNTADPSFFAGPTVLELIE